MALGAVWNRSSAAPPQRLHWPTAHVRRFRQRLQGSQGPAVQGPLVQLWLHADVESLNRLVLHGAQNSSYNIRKVSIYKLNKGSIDLSLLAYAVQIVYLVSY
jgi:hypothetical protein